MEDSIVGLFKYEKLNIVQLSNKETGGTSVHVFFTYENDIPIVLDIFKPLFGLKRNNYRKMKIKGRDRLLTKLDMISKSAVDHHAYYKRKDGKTFSKPLLTKMRKILAYKNFFCAKPNDSRGIIVVGRKPIYDLIPIRENDFNKNGERTITRTFESDFFEDITIESYTINLIDEYVRENIGQDIKEGRKKAAIKFKEMLEKEGYSAYSQMMYVMMLDKIDEYVCN